MNLQEIKEKEIEKFILDRFGYTREAKKILEITRFFSSELERAYKEGFEKGYFHGFCTYKTTIEVANNRANEGFGTGLKYAKEVFLSQKEEPKI